ncbi:type I restriction-modification system subunit M [Pontibacter sp. HSC-14F20]|uniref:type I restriction-modification system subunit M n=1 Tax=Pontibacter sp. HSC-14F20 TaxID=2864136 RepID=UPI001C737689|nr:class I SAM-dependent DNA methyltransferase [Pontibacter sp. HSC-14F20]MBX0332994.1 type I restriction-modification system subunit M [Pontibacter sp. HSC-14F20]
MITGELKNRVDRIWEAFWTGGISNPLTVIEQITYLLFIRRLDELHTAKEKKASLLKQPLKDPIFSEEQQHLRWTRFKDMDAEEMHRIMSMEVFPFIKSFGANDSVFTQQMKDATYMIPTANLLERVVSMLSAIDMSDRDTKGDLYEYLLSKVATAGTNGQFRTPRHIIGMMVEMMAPSPHDTICDPSAGSCGFLVGAGEYLRQKYPNILTTPDLWQHFQHSMFNGLEFDATMVRIGAMNLMLHGIENPQLHYRDALSEANTISEAYTLILANPPFKGSLDHDSVEKSLLKTVSTKKTELLFLALMLRMLKAGGRAAVIVPDGVLFGSSKAHQALRKEIIEQQKLEAVISMPSGVFKPYAGVSTAVLVFTKTNSGGTDQVWFYDMQADGYSLDDKRTPLDASKHENNNIPDLLARWQQRDQERNRARTEQSFMVPLADIQANAYDLSINRYKEAVYAEVRYDSPRTILAAIRQLDEERQRELKELEELLG